MANLTILTDEILERTTPKITATVYDEAGTPIPGVSLDTLSLSLYNLSDAPAYGIINNRNAQDVLNKNGVTVDANGNLYWQTDSADTAVLDQLQSKERHQAVFEWTYNGGIKRGAHVINMVIVNLAKVV